eukprot:gb/GEZN01008216.1/.p1 GENE.gb/GEZN01008216.1/~~gb/GEZN01008216.1/.p1  ORF type:complete len:451 (-),score=82.39 gb/GEZN01008216.1/:39-1391(-)
MSSALVEVCAKEGCGKPASLQCPKCPSFGAKPTYFCDQTCFKDAWKAHTSHHELAKNIRDFRPPEFKWTGPLRPHYVTPMRSVPQHISKPDYHLTGFPESESLIKGTTKIHINSEEEIKGIRLACKLGREVLDIAGKMVRPGVLTEEIDRVVHEETLKRSAYPSPLNYHRFPKSCCTSVNEIICHGIPDCRPLEDGDIVNIDITVYKDGYHGDLNETFLVGNVERKYKDLIKTTYESLMMAIEAVKPGALVKDFGDIISKHVHKGGYSVVRRYCGHGIGALFHSPPNICHYARNKGAGSLKPGMVFTIEPMINMGVWKDQTWPDDWTSATEDGKRSAQFEHTLLVTEEGVEVLTARTDESVPFWWDEQKKKKKKNKKKKKDTEAVFGSEEGVEQNEEEETETGSEYVSTAQTVVATQPAVGANSVATQPAAGAKENDNGEKKKKKKKKKK